MRRIKTNGIRNLFSTITRFGLAVAIAISFLVSVTVAQEREEQPQKPAKAPPKKEALPMEEITVTASRYEKSTFDTPIGVTVVGKQEILEKSPRTPAEALCYKPGIWIQKTGHLGGAPILRGFIGNKVIYLFDSIRRNTAGLFAGPNSFLQNIDSLDINRIEVVRGPGSVLYGSDAIGGIVNVITNEKPQFSSELEYGGRIYPRYGSVDGERDVRVEAYIASQNLYGVVGGSRRNIGDLQGGRGIGIQYPSRWREANWDAQVDYLVASGHRLEFFVQDFSRPYGRRFDRPNWKQENDRELYGIRYFGKDVGFIDDLQVTVYYHDQRGFIDEKFWDSDSDEKTWGGEVQTTSFPLDTLRLVYGFHFHTDDIEKSNPQKGTEDPRVDWTNPALFVLSEWQTAKRLRLDLGLRWDRFALKSDAPPFNKLATAVQDAINSNTFSLSALQLDKTDDAITGGVGAVYSLTDSLNLVGHVGRAFRAPNKSDMLSFGQFTQGFGVPAGELKPESSWTYEGGVKAQTVDSAGALTLFYTTLYDPIVQIQSTFGGSDYIDVNGNGMKDKGEQVFKKANFSGHLNVKGIELEGKSYISKKIAERILGKGILSVLGNFTWMRASATDENQLLGNANGTIPTNGLLGIRWEDQRNPNKRKAWVQFDAHIVARFDSATSTDLATDPAFRVNPQDKKSPLLRPDGSIPGFTTFDLRGGYNFSQNATLTVGIENIGDKKYRNAYSRIDGPGINFVAGLDIKF